MAFKDEEKDLIEKIAVYEKRAEKYKADLLRLRKEGMKLKCIGDFAGKNKGCGRILAPGQVTYIMTHFYISPYGCTDGDYWKEGEGAFICPKCGARNRLYDRPEFNQKPHLFKDVVEEHEHSR